MTDRSISKQKMSLNKMIEAADAYILPVDVTVGHTIIRAGCKVGAVLRSIKVHAQARTADSKRAKRIEEQNQAAYHGDIDGDFNY